MLIALCAILIALVLFRVAGVRLLVAIAQAFLFGAMMLLGVCIGIHSAFAADNSIALSGVSPIIWSIIGTVLAGVVGWLLKLVFQILDIYLQKIGFDLTSDKYSIVIRAAKKIVGSWWAGVEPKVAAAQFDVENPIVADLAQQVLDDLGPIATHLGLTPASAAQFVLWELGELQKTLFHGTLAPAAQGTKP